MDTEQIRNWQEDLLFLAKELRQHHANLYHTISQKRFDEVVTSLLERIPSLSRNTIIVEMSRIVAMIGDGHTSFRFDSNSSLHFRRYPLRFFQFSDGIVVIEADVAHRAYLGAHLKEIGRYSIDEVMSIIRDVVSGDNDFMRQQQSVTALNIPEVLDALTIIPEMNKEALALELVSGENVTVSPPPLEPEAISWINLGDNETPLALWRKYPDRFYWFEYVEAQELVYVNHRVVRDADNETIAAFCERLFDFIDGHPVERLVIDLRSNSGGNNQLNQPLVHGLICCKKVNQTGKLFTIVGRHTFSAAMNLAVDLERNTKTLFVGEPTGASPNHYGETFHITLPHSAISLSIAILYWQSSTPDDKRKWIEPQIPVQMSSKDYLNNLDPLIDAVLSYKQ
jgi:hypothetical protein